ncbi:magnesium transporter CorA family protein [Hoeflea sp. YIM 152468]|uniref:magnesium transporter CorA family protein n=1 Tax=Hoeflea sp. YIM 152468 TaxID=3031759 RepID=UPI0023DBD550|nr:magnesium transporter CorA family protein [Hoeflea sp. YIM 152468]MDF1608472.1 magnesium transporter CorA family protein [Hoeflea sp. YIM 152468]
MIRLYDRAGRALEVPPGAAAPLPDAACWIDLVHPETQEEARVENLIGIEVPSRDELRDIEPSSRLYIENGAAYLTASVVWKSETDFAEIADIGFVLTGERLVTIRYAEPRAFVVFASNAAREFSGLDGRDVLTRLIEAMIDRCAEVLESRSRRIDAVSTEVFSRGTVESPEAVTRDLEATLGVIASHQRTIAKVRESLMSLARVCGFLQTLPEIAGDKALKQRCRSMAVDIQSLSEHADFISENIVFLLDASLGLISVQQNQVMKVVSVVAVVFLPPTFIGTVYGMNFQDMPELALPWAYPIALAVMAASAVGPYLWFKMKGWL